METPQLQRLLLSRTSRKLLLPEFLRDSMMVNLLLRSLEKWKPLRVCSHRSMIWREDSVSCNLSNQSSRMLSRPSKKSLMSVVWAKRLSSNSTRISTLIITAQSKKKSNLSFLTSANLPPKSTNINIPKLKNPKRTLKLNPSFKRHPSNNLTLLSHQQLLKPMSKTWKPYKLEPHPMTLMLLKPSQIQLLTKTWVVLLKKHQPLPRIMLQSHRPIPPLMLPPMQLLPNLLQMLTLMFRLLPKVLEPQLPWQKIAPRLK